MTVKDLRKTLEPDTPIHILYMEDDITIHADDPLMIAAFGSFVIQRIYIESEGRSLGIELKMEPVRE